MTRIYIRFWKGRHGRRRDEQEPRTDISQFELQLHGLRDAPRQGLHQLRRKGRGAPPRVWPARTRGRTVLGAPAARRSNCTSPRPQSAGARRSHHVDRDNVGGRSAHCLAIGVAAGACSAQHAASNCNNRHVEIVCAAQIRVNVTILYQPLTAPNRLGLLGALARGRDLPGRAARGSVAPRKMACRLPCGRSQLAVQGHQLAHRGGAAWSLPLSIKERPPAGPWDRPESMV